MGDRQTLPAIRATAAVLEAAAEALTVLAGELAISGDRATVLREAMRLRAQSEVLRHVAKTAEVAHG